MPEESEPTFEQALTQLERIVEELERGEPALSAALAQYEHGVTLLRHCHRLLDQAEQAVALLTGVDTQGNPLTTPFDATATVARELSSTAAPPDRDVAPHLESQAREPLSTNVTNYRNDPSDTSDPPF